MKEKLAKFTSWLWAVILSVLALILMISFFMPSDKEPQKKATGEKETAAIGLLIEKDTGNKENHEPQETSELKDTEKASEDHSVSPDAGSYLLNTSSKKFHLSSCKSGQKTKESNRSYLSDRERIIEMGYDPCKLCTP